MKRMVLGALLGLLSVNAMAGDHVVEVCHLQSHADRNIAYLSPCGGWDSKSGCSVGGGAWIAWNMSHHQGQSMYSTALAAMLADRKVSVRLSPGSCVGSYDATSMIRIHND